MDYRKLKQVLDESVLRSDMRGWYSEWTRRAFREIQDAYGWEAINDIVSGDITIDAPGQSAPLPSDFRSFISEPSPVHLRKNVSSDISLFPCTLISRAQALSYRASSFYPPSSASLRAPSAGIPVYVTNDGTGRQFLNLMYPAQEQMVFVVEYYAYLPGLEKDEDTNAFLLEYPELVESVLKRVAFTHVNDLPMIAAMTTLVDAAMRRAKRADYEKANKGRKLRMGGGGR